MARTTTLLEYALLGLLKQKPQSGYDLRKSFVITPMRHFSDSPGSIYPALRRLQSRGWLAAGKQRTSRKKQLFRVTPIGERVLITWLKQPVTREEVIWRPDEVMLRFAFQSGNVPGAVTRNFLKGMEREVEAYLRELRQYAKISGLANGSSTGALAFASGIDGYRAQLAWVRAASKKFREK
jgi:DNA-binding PadR family transcriptional regulator